MSPEAILDQLPIDRSAKAAAWDAVQSAQSPDELRESMDSLPLPKAAKAALWDVKADLWQGRPSAHFNSPTIPDVTEEFTPSEPPMSPSLSLEMPSGQDSAVPSPTPEPESRPDAQQPAEPKSQPVANTSDFLKAHNVWKKATTEAAAKFMQEYPGTPYEIAEQTISGTTGVEPKIDDFKALPALAPSNTPAPPEPVKPTKVQKVSAATPTPPTAAIPTAPESPKTIALQLQQLGQFGVPLQPNQRKVVMFPQGQGMPPLETLAGLHIARDKFGNIYAYRPDLITRSQITHAANNNKLPEILGGPLGMGAPDKSVIQAPVFAVTGRAPDGTEAQTTVTDVPSLANTILAAHAATPAGGTLEIKRPQEALTARQASPAQVPVLKGVIQPQQVSRSIPVRPPDVRPAPSVQPNSNPATQMFADGRPSGALNRNGKNNPSNQIPVNPQQGSSQPGTGFVPPILQGNGPAPLRGFSGPAIGPSLHGESQPIAGSDGAGIRGSVAGETRSGKPQSGVRRITGSADIPLTHAGQQQADQLTRKAVVPFNAVISAPSTRATQTAAKFGMPRVLSSLDGWARGIYEGQPSDRVKMQMAGLMLNPDQVPTGLSPISGKPGQSWAQMAKTMFADVQDVAAKTPPKSRILMVTSGGNLQAIDAWGKAGYPADFEFPHDKIAAQPYWSVTGKMFKLGDDGLREVKSNTTPGIYFIEHGETAFNSKGEKKVAPVTREAFRQISDFPKAMQIYDQTPDAAKRALFRDARDKAFAVKYRPEVWTPEAKQIAGKHFNVAPVSVRRVYQGPQAATPSLFPDPPPIGAR